MSSPHPDPGSSSVTGHPWLRRLRQTRFTQLLATLSLLLVVAPIASALDDERDRFVASWLIVLALSFVLIAAAAAVINSRRQSAVVLTLAGMCLGSMVARTIFHLPLDTFEGIVMIGFLSYVVCLIIRALFRQHDVNFDKIAASLCGYLLIGVIFSVVYSLVLDFDPNAVSVNSAASEDMANLHFGDHRTATSLYFSFVTLTTLGYGDLTPVSMTARMLTAAEAVIGQLYLVVLVARLVGLHIARGGLASRSDDDE